MMPKLIIASSNAHKVEELSKMLRATNLELEVCSMQDLGQPPQIEETALDFRGNAALKSEGVAAWVASSHPELIDHAWVLADDSGLCVEALDGAPGVYSARFAGPDATDAQNNQKLVSELKARGLQQSPAYFCCALALTRVGGSAASTRFFEGRATGSARVQAAGEGGFGYDPHVWIDGQSGSFAQMSQAEKSSASHRGHALRALLKDLPGILIKDSNTSAS